MTTEVMEKEEKTTKKSDKEIIDLLFEIIEKPKDIYKIKVINVFENNYRINIWSEFFDSANKLMKKKIGHSYFCKIKNNKLIII